MSASSHFTAATMESYSSCELWTDSLHSGDVPVMKRDPDAGAPVTADCIKADADEVAPGDSTGGATAVLNPKPKGIKGLVSRSLKKLVLHRKAQPTTPMESGPHSDGSTLNAPVECGSNSNSSTLQCMSKSHLQAFLSASLRTLRSRTSKSLTDSSKDMERDTRSGRFTSSLKNMMAKMKAVNTSKKELVLHIDTQATEVPVAADCSVTLTVIDDKSSKSAAAKKGGGWYRAMSKAVPKALRNSSKKVLKSLTRKDQSVEEVQSCTTERAAYEPAQEPHNTVLVECC